jgi:hypothetical protein
LTSRRGVGGLGGVEPSGVEFVGAGPLVVAFDGRRSCSISSNRRLVAQPLRSDEPVS